MDMIKCIIWDADNTLWDGILSEGHVLRPREEVAALIHALDERGVLQSIASRNDEPELIQILRESKLDEFFLSPQIHWGAKSESIKRITEDLGIDPRHVGFVDDDPVERAEVGHMFPGVRLFDSNLPDLVAQIMQHVPPGVTPESRARRHMYVADATRKRAEANFVGPEAEFLRTLDLKLCLDVATPAHIPRVAELVARTNQLNTSGYTYGEEQLTELSANPSHTLLVASLNDRFGDYGAIGVCLLDLSARDSAILKLLLVSCRVLSRGVGGILLTIAIRLALSQKGSIDAHFMDTGRNRAMYVTLRFAGFEEHRSEGGLQVLRYSSGSAPREIPGHFTVNFSPEVLRRFST